MATTSIEDRPTLAPAVRSLLGSLRRRIRRYVWLEGLGCSVAWLGAAFWASLVIDWFFEPPAAVRSATLAAAVLGFLWIMVRLIGRRAFVRLSDGNMATLLERHFPLFDDGLLTAVLLTDRAENDEARMTDDESAGRSSFVTQCNPQMLAHTCRQATQQVGQVRLKEIFNPVPLRQSIVAAVLFSITVGLFAHQSPNAFGTWARRSLLLSDELWPRRTRLVVEGFKEDPVRQRRVAKVARGADLEVIAKADTSKEFVPEVVQVRYQTEGGARGRASMTRLGVAVPERDPFQEYSYSFQGVLAPIRFDVVGGDDRVRDLWIEVVESPNLIDISLECRFPAYMDRPPRTVPTTPVMQIPFGTRVTVDSTADKDLVRVQIDTTLGEESLPPKVIESKGLGSQQRGFRHTLESLKRETVLLFTLSDTDGITSRDPVRLSLVPIADQPPQLTARLTGIGDQITARAQLPAAGSISDDYGIDEAYFAYTVDQQPPARRPIALPPGNTAELKLEAVFPVEDLKLTPGQKLLVSVKAADRYDLGTGPNIGSSQRRLLDVVTPEQLRASLEKRELVLRQRFERIIQEVTETRDLLARIEFTAPDADENTEGDPAEEATDDGAEPGDEPGDEPNKEPAEGSDASSPERQATLRKLRVQRAMQDGRKNANETRGVAEAFDDIRRQFINNRIDTQELNSRLKQGIADPLLRITDEMFPELQRRLERLEDNVADGQLGPAKRDLARQQADEIRLQMQEVLGRMLELEDFNEALELLRTIIELQNELGERTKQRQKEKIRELLED